MNPQLYIITGASRGLGLALAQQLLGPGMHLLCISRQQNTALAQSAQAAGATLEQWPLDLDHGQAAGSMLLQWLQKPGFANRFGSATLINNAAALPAIAPLWQTGGDDISRVVRVGLEAPLHLSAAFLQATRGWTGADGNPTQRKLLNISSGLGRRPMASQALYCAVKSGIDHFTRCLALEEALVPNGAKVCALAPGVIDTDMQTQLRSADAASFPDRANFVDLKANAQLLTATACAQKVLVLLHSANFGSNPVADIRDAA